MSLNQPSHPLFSRRSHNLKGVAGESATYHSYLEEKSMRQLCVFRGILMVLSSIAVCAPSSKAAIIWNEGVSGDLSNNQAVPTPLTLAAGTNSVIGAVGTGDTQDWVALTILAGFKLSSDILAGYTSTDGQGFTGVQAGSSFVGNPETTPGAYLGYAHFGTSATNGPLSLANLVGVDLLPIMGNTTDAPGSQGFATPLAAGTYTFLIQQLGAPTSYQFDFGVTPVPEPGALCLLGLVGLGMTLRRSTCISRAE
jgi:hypothetical protein